MHIDYNSNSPCEGELKLCNDTEQHSHLNGHTIETHVKKDSTLKKCATSALNFFKNLPFFIKVPLGLVLLGVSVVAFVALSPKLFALAVAVSSVVGALGIFVLLQATISKIMKSTKNENNPIANEDSLKQMRDVIKVELFSPLSIFLNNPYILKEKKEELNKIRDEVVTFMLSTPANHQEVKNKIFAFKEKIVNKLLENINYIDEKGNPISKIDLEILGQLGLSAESQCMIIKCNSWVKLNEENLSKPQFFHIKETVYNAIYDAITQNLASEDILIDPLLENYENIMLSINI